MEDNQDIPGCEDNYYRCMITFLRISCGWIELFSTIILIISTVLNAIISTNYLNSNTTMILSIISSFSTGLISGLRMLKNFTVTDENKYKQLLHEIVINYDNKK